MMRTTTGNKTVYALIIITFFTVTTGFCNAEDLRIVFPEKIKVEDIRSKTSSGKFVDLEVGRFSSIEAINLSTETKFRFFSDHYTKATFSIFGFPKGAINKDCNVGIIVWPNEKEIIEAWRRDRSIILANQLNAMVSKSKSHYEGQMDLDLSFNEYIFGFFNTCNTNVEMNVYYTLKQL